MSSELCQSCGFCCNGILFNRVSLYPEEVEMARRNKLPLLNETRLRQPCGALGADGACRVYDERPRRCVQYRCTTLQALETQAIDLAAARARVERARALIADVGARLPKGDESVWKRAGDLLAEKVLSEEEKSGLMRALEALAVVLRREFDDRFDPAPEVRGTLY